MQVLHYSTSNVVMRLKYATKECLISIWGCHIAVLKTTTMPNNECNSWFSRRQQVQCLTAEFRSQYQCSVRMWGHCIFSVKLQWSTELPIKVRTYIHCVDVCVLDRFTQGIWSPPLTDVLQYSTITGLKYPTEQCLIFTQPHATLNTKRWSAMT